MTRKMQKFLVSAGEADQEYGLYVMEKESPHHAKDALLAYHYDSNSFFFVRDQDKGLFISALELKSCKDEFGNEFSGENLLKRIEDAIKAYEEELPGYVQNVLSYPLPDDDE
jgi:hypothetical protein